MWFQMVGFVLSRTVGKVFFTAPPSMSSTRSYEHNVFF